MSRDKDAIFVNIHVEHGGAAEVTHGPPGSGRHDRAPRATRHDAGASHTWKVQYKGKLYELSTTAGEMKIVLDGETVWRGERGPHRAYRAQWSKLEPAVETKVLELARSGDRHSHDDRAEAPPPSAPRVRAQRDAAPRSTPKADPPAAETKRRAAKTATTEKPATDKPARKRAAAKKVAAKKVAAKKGTAPRQRAPEATAAQNGTVVVAAHSRSAPGSKPPSEVAKPKRTAAKKTAPNGPRAKAEQPVSQRSAKPVDDEKVMTDLLKGLEKDAPQTAAAAYATLRKAWFNGAREVVLAHVRDNPAIKSIAKAYAEWAGTNHEQVRTMAAKAA